MDDRSPLSPTAEAVLAQLTTGPFRPVDELVRVPRPGVYAWWGVLPLPSALPDVPAGLPVYIGKADTESLGARARSFHLSRTRGSALRRTLAAVLAAELELAPEVVTDVRSWGLAGAGEERLTAWMRERLHVSWVELDAPGSVEEELIAHLLPPMNDRHATGSPYRVAMRQLRSRMRSGAQ